MDLSFDVIKECSPKIIGQQFSNVCSIVTRFYCGKLRVHGFCNGNCLTTCKAHLTTMLFELEKGEKPGALLTWRAKNEAAKAVEKFREEERHKPDRRPPVIFNQAPSPENPFLAFLEKLE